MPSTKCHTRAENGALNQWPLPSHAFMLKQIFDREIFARSLESIFVVDCFRDTLFKHFQKISHFSHFNSFTYWIVQLNASNYPTSFKILPIFSFCNALDLLILSNNANSLHSYLFFQIFQFFQILSTLLNPANSPRSFQFSKISIVPNLTNSFFNLLTILHSRDLRTNSLYSC